MPVKAGDVLGLDDASDRLMFANPDTPYVSAYYNPALADNAAASAPTGSQSGYKLLLSAVVQASTTTTTTGTSGTTTSTVPPGTPPSLTKVAQSHRRWREGSKLAKFASGNKPPVGTTFRFTLNESASVRFVFTQRGHKRGRLSFSAAAGAHKLRFQGRLTKHKRLKPGHYALTITATNGSNQSASAKLKFTIVAP